MNQSFKNAAEEIDEQIARGEEGRGLERVQGGAASDVDAIYMIRFTGDELAIVRAKATHQGLSLSEYVRQAAMSVASRDEASVAKKRPQPRQARSSTANNLIDIEGIGTTYARTLADAGLKTTDDLLKAAGSPTGREDLAAKTSLTEARILEWVKRADLMRIKGVGSEFSDLLEAAGVETVKELAQRTPANLHAKLAEVNAARKLVHRVPNLTEVQAWVAEAKSMPLAVMY